MVSLTVFHNLLIVHLHAVWESITQSLKERERESVNKRQIYIEPSVTLELSVPQHVLHTLYRLGQRPNETASKAALGSHTNTHTWKQTHIYLTHTHSGLQMTWWASQPQNLTATWYCRAFWQDQVMFSPEFLLPHQIHFESTEFKIWV